MADFYKILKADPLGDPWESHGKQIQNYWCQVEGQEKAVSIGKQVGNTLAPGQHVYGDLTYAKSQKGTEYWKFKSVQVPEGVQRPADSPAQAQAQAATTGGAYADEWAKQQEVLGTNVPAWAVPLCNQVQFIFNEMKKMSDEPAEPSVVPDAPTTTPAPADGVSKEELDAMFDSPPEVPESPEEV